MIQELKKNPTTIDYVGEFTTQLASDYKQDAKNLKSAWNAKDIEKALETLNRIAEKASIVFGIIGAGGSLIDVLTGSSIGAQLSEIEQQIKELSAELKTDFQRLENLIQKEFADADYKKYENVLQGLYDTYCKYKDDPSPDNATDLKKIVTSDIQAAIQGFYSLAKDSPNYFENIKGYYGNSPTVMLSKGLHMITLIRNAITALVQSSILKNQTGKMTKAQKREMVNAAIKNANEYAIDFTQKSPASMTDLIRQKMYQQIKSFDPQKDVYTFFQTKFPDKFNFTKTTDSSDDRSVEETQHKNCQNMVDILHANYGSRVFHAFITYKAINNDNYGLIRFSNNVEAFTFQDSNGAVGTDWGKYYITIVHAYNLNSSSNPGGVLDTVIDCFSRDPSKSPAMPKDPQGGLNTGITTGPHIGDGSVIQTYYTDYDLYWRNIVGDGFLFIGYGKSEYQDGQRPGYASAPKTPKAKDGSAYWYEGSLSKNEWLNDTVNITYMATPEYWNIK